MELPNDDHPLVLGSGDDPTEYRIYASNDPDFYVIVDYEDYKFLVLFAWSIHSYLVGRSGRQAGYRRKQLYLRRSVSDFYGPDGSPYESPITGKIARNRQRVQRNLFLHLVVMLRKGDIPPDKHHCVVGHVDNNSRNCRRSNVAWITHAMNVKHGIEHRDVHR